MNDALYTLNLKRDYIMNERLMNPLNDKYDLPWAKTTLVKYRGDKMSEKIVTYPPKVIYRDGKQITTMPMELHWYDSNENEVNAYYIEDVDTLKSNFVTRITRIQSRYDERQRILKKYIRKGFLIYNKLLPHEYDIQYVKNHNIHYDYADKCDISELKCYNCNITEEDLGMTFNHGGYIYDLSINDEDPNSWHLICNTFCGYEYDIANRPNNFGDRLEEEYKDNKGNVILKTYKLSNQIEYKKHTRDGLIISETAYSYDEDRIDTVTFIPNGKDKLFYKFIYDVDHDIRKIKIYDPKMNMDAPIGEKTFMFRDKSSCDIFNLPEIIPNDIKKIIGAAESYRFGHLVNSGYNY